MWKYSFYLAANSSWYIHPCKHPLLWVKVTKKKFREKSNCGPSNWANIWCNVTYLLHVFVIVDPCNVSWVENRIEILAHLLIDDLRIDKQKCHRQILKPSKLEHILDIIPPVFHGVILDDFYLEQLVVWDERSHFGKWLSTRSSNTEQ